MTLNEGTRIYYTGDMANQDGFGTVTKTYENKLQRTSFVDVALDDGRKMRGLHTLGFSATYNGTCSPRFTTEAAYNEWRDSR